jgi:hypothetical protein
MTGSLDMGFVGAGAAAAGAGVPMSPLAGAAGAGVPASPLGGGAAPSVAGGGVVPSAGGAVLSVGGVEPSSLVSALPQPVSAVASTAAASQPHRLNMGFSPPL